MKLISLIFALLALITTSIADYIEVGPGVLEMK
jgi:hypothetical protein